MGAAIAMQGGRLQNVAHLHVPAVCVVSGCARRATRPLLQCPHVPSIARPAVENCAPPEPFGVVALVTQCMPSTEVQSPYIYSSVVPIYRYIYLDTVHFACTGGVCDVVQDRLACMQGLTYSLAGRNCVAVPNSILLAVRRRSKCTVCGYSYHGRHAGGA